MGRMFGAFILFKHLAKKVWRMNRSAKGLLMVPTNLDGLNLANCRQFAKFDKLSTCQTFLLYGIKITNLSLTNQSLIMNVISCFLKQRLISTPILNVTGFEKRGLIHAIMDNLEICF